MKRFIFVIVMTFVATATVFAQDSYPMRYSFESKSHPEYNSAEEIPENVVTNFFTQIIWKTISSDMQIMLRDEILKVYDSKTQIKEYHYNGFTFICDLRGSDKYGNCFTLKNKDFCLKVYNFPWILWINPERVIGK